MRVSKKLEKLEKLTLRSKLSTILLCAACLMLLAACSKDDDKIVVQTQHKWVDKKVAVVYPNRNAMTKAQLERTAHWFLDNFQEAQLSTGVCVRLKLEWYDELTANLDALSTQLANDPDVAAIVGPFNSTSLEVFAEACQQTEKPLIAPTATSEEIIRRYAVPTQSGTRTVRPFLWSLTESDVVPTQSGTRTVRPFLWSLTESDVAFAEVVMSAYATMSQRHSFITPSAIVFSPDNVYGKTFFDWAPFQAENLGIDISDNLQYRSTDELLQQIKAHLYTGEGDIFTALYSNFCVIETIDQLCQVTAWRRKCYIDFMEVNDWLGLPDTTPYDDPAYDNMAAEISAYRRVYFALSDFSQEEINALTERQRAMLLQYEGFSPYADPTTGFEMSYERKFGVKPTFEECKFYDGLLLAGLACHKLAASDNSQLSIVNSQFNQAIYDLTFPNADASLSATVWDASPMALYLQSLDKGQVPQFRGASGKRATTAPARPPWPGNTSTTRTSPSSALPSRRRTRRRPSTTRRSPASTPCSCMPAPSSRTTVTSPTCSASISS